MHHYIRKDKHETCTNSVVKGASVTFEDKICAVCKILNFSSFRLRVLLMHFYGNDISDAPWLG